MSQFETVLVYPRCSPVIISSCRSRECLSVADKFHRQPRCGARWDATGSEEEQEVGYGARWLDVGNAITLAAYSPAGSWAQALSARECCHIYSQLRDRLKDDSNSKCSWHSANLFFLFFVCLAAPHGLQDFNSLTRDRTHALQSKCWVLSPGLSANSEYKSFLILSSSISNLSTNTKFSAFKTPFKPFSHIHLLHYLSISSHCDLSPRFF